MLRKTLVAGLIGIGFAAGALAQTFTMKLAVPTLNDPNHEFIKRYKEAIEKASGGRITAQLYPGGQLGQPQQVIEAVQLGSVELFSIPPNFLRGVDARFQAFDGAGVYDSITHAHRSMTDPAVRSQVLDIGVPKGVKGTAIWVYGGTAYASTKPLRTVKDFSGKKVRILATRLEQALMKQLGATGVPIDYSQVLPALQQGGVDAIRANLVAMGTAKFYTVAKYVTLVDDVYIPEVAFVSVAFLNRLPPDLRAVVERVGPELEEGMLRFAVEFDASESKRWQENGSEVIRLAPAEQAEFIKRARSATEQFINDHPEVRSTYKLLSDSAARHRKN